MHKEKLLVKAPHKFHPCVNDGCPFLRITLIHKHLIGGSAKKGLRCVSSK